MRINNTFTDKEFLEIKEIFNSLPDPKTYKSHFYISTLNDSKTQCVWEKNERDNTWNLMLDN